METSVPQQGKTGWTHVLIILATIALTYSAVVAFDYGYVDDYWVLSMRPLNHDVLSTNILNNNTEGRPLLSIWQLGVFGLCDGVTDLKYVRLLSVVGIFFSSIVFYKLVRFYLIEDAIDAALVAAIFSINPTFLITGGWAENGHISYGTMFGLLSIYVCLRDESFGPPWYRPWHRFTFSALLLFIATFLYQPTAMIYWLGVAVWIIGRFSPSRGEWIKLGKMAALFFFVIFAYFIICHAFWPPSGRFHLSFSFIRRAGWFVVFPLRSTLSYPLIQPSTIWSVFALFILSYGLWSFCRQASRTMWIPPLILIMTPLTVLPTIVAYVHYDVSRTRGALYGLVIVLWYVTLTALVKSRSWSLKPRQLLIPCLVILSVWGQYHLQRYFVMPQLWEEGALQISSHEYLKENPKMDRAIAIWPPPYEITEFRGVDEMGFASLSRPYSPIYEIPIFLAKAAHCNVEDVPRLQIVTLSDNDTPPKDSFVIDFRRLPVTR